MMIGPSPRFMALSPHRRENGAGLRDTQVPPWRWVQNCPSTYIIYPPTYLPIDPSIDTESSSPKKPSDQSEQRNDVPAPSTRAKRQSQVPSLSPQGTLWTLTCNSRSADLAAVELATTSRADCAL